MKPGFIVVEGLEGAGKTSVINVIKRLLEDRGLSTISTREPGGTPMAEAIRECVKSNWDEKVTQETELLLMYAARSQLVENVIKTAIDNKQWVIGDRHNWSSLAYQGAGRGLDMNKLHTLKQMTLGDFEADLTIYLDVSPDVGLTRARGRGELDRIEQSGIAFFNRARACFKQLVEETENAVEIDANQTIDVVHQQVFDAVNNWLIESEQRA